MVSPLTNLDILAPGNAAFSEMVEDNELPVCPPYRSDRHEHIYFDRTHQTGEGPRKIKIIDHAGLFADPMLVEI